MYRIYRNLHNGLLSIQCIKTKRVCGYASSVTLKHAKFSVNQRGRELVIKTKQKNVHAFVIGSILSVNGFISRKDRTITSVSGNPVFKNIIVTYNPYKYSTFVSVETQQMISMSMYCEVHSSGKILI